MKAPRANGVAGAVADARGGGSRGRDQPHTVLDELYGRLEAAVGAAKKHSLVIAANARLLAYADGNF